MPVEAELMDLESYRRWYDYSRARNMMLEQTDSEHAPWHIARSDDKRRGRLNCIAHILRSVPFKKLAQTKVKLPKRSDKASMTTRRRRTVENSLLKRTERT
jgi:hypothetical protein